jgi:hypothetical protein
VTEDLTLERDWFRQALHRTPSNEVVSILAVSARVVRVELNGALELFLRSGPIPIEIINITQRGMRFGYVVVNLESFSRCGFGSLPRF